MDGNDALNKTLGLKPDVLLLDLAIPELTGVGVVKALRERQSAVTIVLMSQQDPEVMKRIAASVAVTLYVTKSELATALPNLLHKIADSHSR